MKKLFLVILTLVCILTVEFFQSTAQKQRINELPDFATASSANSFAAYEVHFSQGQQEVQREALWKILAEGNHKDDLYKDMVKAVKAGVLEIDQSTPNVYYYGGMTGPVHNLFPISGVPEIEFNSEQEQGYYSGIRHDDQAFQFSMIRNGDVRLYPLNKAHSDKDSTVLYFFAQEPSVWIDLIYQMSEQFPDMTFHKKNIDQVYPFTKYSMMAADQQRKRNQYSLAAAVVLTVLLAFTVSKGKDPWHDYLVTALSSLFIIPSVILILSRLQSVVWNTYTNFYYTDLFRFFGFVTAGFALVGILTVYRVCRNR